MSIHPVLDAEELDRVLDAAPIEAVIAALVRRAERLCALAEAAYADAARTAILGRRSEMYGRCFSSARLCDQLADAVKALAPDHEEQRKAAAFARVAENFSQMARALLNQRERVGNA